MAAGGAAGAVVGSAICPVVVTLVGAGVGIIVSAVYDYYTSDAKQIVRDALANEIRR